MRGFADNRRCLPGQTRTRPIQPIQHTFQTTSQTNSQTGGPRICYFEWGTPGKQPVLLLHATGFHARCWDQTIAALGSDFHVIAIDMRGHGRSDRVEPYIWHSFADDICELVTHLSLTDAIGVGHSMGGHCLVHVAAREPGAFKHLVLVDPVIFEPDAYATDRYRGFEGPEDHPVSRRHNDFGNWQDMHERFKGRGSFAVWDDRVLEDYCRYGVALKEDGTGYELACPPLVESSIYLGNTSTDVYQQIPKVEVPVVVLRARGRDPDQHEIMDFSTSPTWSEVASQFKLGRDVYLPELTHFMPMQAPELVAGYIREGASSPSTGMARGVPE